MDRPHIVYNQCTRKYVAWLKIMGEPPCFAVLEADQILGPYTMVNPRVNPCGMAVGDFDIAVAPEDGKAYLFSERPHVTIYCADLNTEYTDATGMYTEHFPHIAPPASREAPVHFMRNGLHYLITSGTSGYHPNPSEVPVSELWHGPWRVQGNPHVNDNSRTSFNSQITSVFKHPFKKDLYIALADRWMPNLREKEGPAFDTGEAYEKFAQRFEKIFAPDSDFVFSPEDAKEMFINSSISDYVWLPLRFEGDQVRSERALPFKYEMYQLAGTYAKLAKDAGVEIRTNTAVDRAYAESFAPDALIIAAGSAPLVPPIPGLDGDNVVVVNNYYREEEKVGEDVVVFGGGLAGCECAIHLGQLGKKVHLIEMRQELAPDANVRHRPLLLKEIEKYVTVHTGYKGLEVRDDGILCEIGEGKQVLVPGHSIICALGQRSRTDVVEELRTAAPFVRVIGDAAKVSTITNAVYWGYHAALDI